MRKQRSEMTQDTYTDFHGMHAMVIHGEWDVCQNDLVVSKKFMC